MHHPPTSLSVAEGAQGELPWRWHATRCDAPPSVLAKMRLRCTMVPSTILAPCSANFLAPRSCCFLGFLSYAHAGLGLSLALNGRALVLHETEGVAGGARAAGCGAGAHGSGRVEARFGYGLPLDAGVGVPGPAWASRSARGATGWAMSSSRRCRRSAHRAGGRPPRACRRRARAHPLHRVDHALAAGYGRAASLTPQTAPPTVPSPDGRRGFQAA